VPADGLTHPLGVAARTVGVDRSVVLAAPAVRLTRLGRIALTLVVTLLGLAMIAAAMMTAGRHGRPTPSLPSSAPAVVVVQPGETLWTIARRVAPSRDPREIVTELRRLNALPSADVRAGQQLRLRER
jgi:LysM repeat protein